MGGKSSKEEILNDTNIQTSLKNTINVLNETVKRSVQSHAETKNISSKQSNVVKISNVKSTGAYVANIDQENTGDVEVSVAIDTKLLSDSKNDIKNDMKESISNAIDAVTSIANEDGEQPISGLLDAASASLSVGGSNDEKKITNKFAVKVKTELSKTLSNKFIDETISNTLNEITTSLSQLNEITQQNIDVNHPDGVILTFSQKNISSILLDSIAKSDMSTKMLAAALNVSDTTIDQAVKSKTETSLKKTNIIDSTFSGVNSMLSTLVSGPMLILIGVVVIGGGGFYLMTQGDQYGGSKDKSVFLSLVYIILIMWTMRMSSQRRARRVKNIIEKLSPVLSNKDIKLQLHPHNNYLCMIPSNNGIKLKELKINEHEYSFSNQEDDTILTVLPNNMLTLKKYNLDNLNTTNFTITGNTIQYNSIPITLNPNNYLEVSQIYTPLSFI